MHEVRNLPGELRAEGGGELLPTAALPTLPLASRGTGELRGRGDDSSWLKALVFFQVEGSKNILYWKKVLKRKFVLGLPGREK